MELARGIEPSNRRRVGLGACLPAPAEGASPLACSPRRGHIPFETPRLEVQLYGAGRGIEPPTCGLQKPTEAISSDQESPDKIDERLDGSGEYRLLVIASSCAECEVVSV